MSINTAARRESALHARFGVFALQRPASSVDRLTSLRHYVGIPVSTVVTPTQAICAALALSTYSAALTGQPHHSAVLALSTYSASLVGAATYSTALTLTVCED